MIVNKYNGGGGGGGSYTLPTATANRLGGIKVGSGLTVENDGTLSVSGESSESNYLIVDALSAITNPVEGMMAIERTVSEQSEYIKLYVSDPNDYPDQEGYWGHLVEGNGDPIDGYGSVYFTSDDNKFHWDWDEEAEHNPSEWTTNEYNSEYYEYRVIRDDNDHSNNEFHIRFASGGTLGIEPIDDEGNAVTGIATAVTAETIYTYSTPYVYQDSRWIPVYKTYDKIELKEKCVTSADTISVFNEMYEMVKMGRAPFVFDKDHNAMMVLDTCRGDVITFMFDRGGVGYYFYLSSTYFEENDFDHRGMKEDEDAWIYSHAPIQHNIGINSDGEFVNPGEELGIFAEENHMDQIYFRWEPYVEGNPDWGMAPLKYIYRKVEPVTIDDGESEPYEEDRLVYYWGAEIPINGVVYQGDWKCVEHEWENYETVNWTVATYPAFQLSTFDIEGFEENDIAVLESMFEFYDNFYFGTVNPDRLLYCGELDKFFNFEGLIDEVEGFSFFNSENRVEIVREYNDQDDEYTYSIEVKPLAHGTDEPEIGYIDFYVNATDPTNPDIIRDPISGLSWESADIAPFAHAVAGDEGYELSEKSVRIHFMADDGEGGYQETGDPIQYGKIEEKVVMDTDSSDVCYKVVMYMPNFSPAVKYYFEVESTVYDNGEGIVGGLNIVHYSLKKDPNSLSIDICLVPMDAKIHISLSGATGVSFDENNSEFSLEKFALALDRGTVARDAVHVADTGGAADVWSPIYLVRNNGFFGTNSPNSIQFACYGLNINKLLLQIELGPDGEYLVLNNRGNDTPYFE